MRPAFPGPEAAAPGGTVRRLERVGRDELDWLERSWHRVEVAGLHTPVRVLHVTDAHVRQDDDRLRRLCERIDAACAEDRPDLVAMTGDLVGLGWEDPALDRLLRALPSPGLGRVAVPGNWDAWAVAARTGGRPFHRVEDLGPWEATLAEAGVEVLRNRGVQRGPLWVAGTEDAVSNTADAALALAGRAGPVLGLTHCPEVFQELAVAGAAVVLAGHSHGGQVRLPRLGALVVPRGTGRWVAGWYEHHGAWGYVGRGLGWSVAPMRAFCPPELAVVDLVPIVSG